MGRDASAFKQSIKGPKITPGDKSIYWGMKTYESTSHSSSSMKCETNQRVL
jgi:hypothetical protein